MIDEFDDVLEVFVTFCKIIDEPPLTESMEKQDFVKIYDCCEFIENFITKVREQEKEVEFEKYLNYRLSTTYQCSNFEKACDKMLEILMKDPRVSTRKIDILFSIYIQRFGQERFRTFLDSNLKDAMYSNLILNSLAEQQVPISELRDDAIFFTWDKQVTNGKKIEVAQYIDNMLDDNQVSKLIDGCLNSKMKPKTKNLIMERFTLRAFENNRKFFQEILEVEPTKLVKILQENSKFCTNFLDTVFYFGRSMFFQEGNWISEEGVQYEDIAKIFRILLTESNEISCQTQRQLNIAKEMDGNFWEDIERDCVRLYIVKNVN
ncbi:uncharacterized protein LOC122511229 [Leptopilina heterotoma]|uniref:uncharacterized protein LOC122511229 n=1 Tax=Leptopilina heterotoma TaxID=63436 RepID=UPI001CA7E283|nr:uncharacterized protein LOC122511229 [Leptopilina heterotoma]